MNILIELPTWLGDTIMASPAIENIALNFPNSKITFFGSAVSCEIYKNHPNCFNSIIDKTKTDKFRLLNLIKIAKKMPKFDLIVSFRSSFASKIFLKFLKSDKKFIYKKEKIELHQVIRYENFVKNSLDIKIKFDDLKIYFDKKEFFKPTLGINPGATYGNAKRWYPQYFAEVALYFADKYDIIIFGSNNEKDICKKIEDLIVKNNKRCINKCGQTNIKELCEYIGGLDLFLTNDSGPMHIAAIYKTPTIALFGPTNFKETSPYKNKNTRLVHLDLNCMPCMKRICPLKTHECMKNLLPKKVIEEAKILLKNS